MGSGRRGGGGEAFLQLVWVKAKKRAPGQGQGAWGVGAGPMFREF